MTERDKDLDRPALFFGAHTDGSVTELPQLIGLISDEGVPFQMSRERAIQEGFIPENFPKRRMPVRDYIIWKNNK